ncbi:MAG: DNA alkylation repair protein [Chitinispirillales bacterium]|jgi:hypothetical protein|nr:DNA alkylation repair protein [Chitinispirillales bacterium]
MCEINEKIREKLNFLADENSKDFVDFSKNILVSKKKIIGARVPDMRKIAKDLSKNLSFENLISVIENCDKNVYEEVFVCGIIISYSKLPDEEKIKAIKIYLEFVDSWALIDSAIMIKNFEKTNENLWAEFVEECIVSQKEFVVRFGVVFMLHHFISETKIDWVFENLRKIKHDGYYVKMAVAWLYAESARDFFDKTTNELNKKEMNAWIRNKTLQKILESYRILSDKKEFIRNLKRASRASI